MREVESHSYCCCREADRSLVIVGVTAAARRLTPLTLASPLSLENRNCPSKSLPARLDNLVVRWFAHTA
jgi:hypothetical protein